MKQMEFRYSSRKTFYVVWMVLYLLSSLVVLFAATRIYPFIQGSAGFQALFSGGFARMVLIFLAFVAFLVVCIGIPADLARTLTDRRGGIVCHAGHMELQLAGKRRIIAYHEIHRIEKFTRVYTMRKGARTPNENNVDWFVYRITTAAGPLVLATSMMEFEQRSDPDRPDPDTLSLDEAMQELCRRVADARGDSYPRFELITHRRKESRKVS